MRRQLIIFWSLSVLTFWCCNTTAIDQTNQKTAYEPTVVVNWNEAMLAAIQSGDPKPTIITRQMFIVHTAIYDAWTAYDRVANPVYLQLPHRPIREHNELNRLETVSFAAYETLIHLFPAYEKETGAFRKMINQLGIDLQADPLSNSPADIGKKAAAAVIKARQNDGANASAAYDDAVSQTFPRLYAPVNAGDPNSPHGIGGSQFDPNAWQPLWVPTGTFADRLGHPAVNPDKPDSYKEQTFLTPHWGAVTPFALTSGSQFRPPPPPRLNNMNQYTDGLGQTMTEDEAYRRQFSEVLVMSGQLTDEQKVIAEYWADGPRSETPPGHWNALAHGIAFRDRHTLDEDVKLFFALNCALLDAAIAAWDAKRHYNFVRPQTAIRYLYSGQMVKAWGGPDQGSRWILADTWRPYQELTFVTPAFPEYVSGHSVFSAAASEVLTRFTGSDRFYDGKTRLPNDFNKDRSPDMLGEHIVHAGGNQFENSPSKQVTLRWPTFKDAANEAGSSRLYGGIHIQDGDLRGRVVGKQVGAQSYAKAKVYWQGKNYKRLKEGISNSLTLTWWGDWLVPYQ